PGPGARWATSPGTSPSGSDLLTACCAAGASPPAGPWGCAPCCGPRGAAIGGPRPHPGRWRPTWRPSWRPGPPCFSTTPTAPLTPGRGARPWGPCPSWPSASLSGATGSAPWPNTASTAAHLAEDPAPGGGVGPGPGRGRPAGGGDGGADEGGGHGRLHDGNGQVESPALEVVEPGGHGHGRPPRAPPAR